MAASSASKQQLNLFSSSSSSSSTQHSSISNAPFTLPHAPPHLSRASHLTRPELLRRRLHYITHLSKCYRDLYWSLMDDLKLHYRDYSWQYGLSPFKDCTLMEGQSGNFDGDDADYHACAFVGCKLKAMPFTSFCHLHILSDPNQILYKPCTYVIKSAQAGPITCGKPILSATTPSLCSVHLQKAQKHLTGTLKRANLNNPSACKLAPKFHVIVTEYVRQIQMKRRQLKSNRRITIKEEKDN